jgi:hypothetical protein
VDGLLRKTFKDDLPPEIEESMRSRFSQFRSNLDSAHQKRLWPSILDSSFLGKMQARQALAFASLLMISLGGFLHLSGQRTAMAETLAFVHASLSISDQLLRVTSMKCTLKAPKELGATEYSILWLSPDRARVDARQGVSADKTLWVTASGVVVTDRMNGADHHYQGLSEVEDPLFEPALEFLTPETISRAIYGKWIPKQYKQHRGEERLTLAYINYEGKTLLEMTVDLSTDLPMSIKRFAPNDAVPKPGSEHELEAHFVWDEPISSQLLIREE